jgi:NAD(P)-dependent dehydrogenase (short-subunit alcohol dehydrogenase family)
LVVVGLEPTPEFPQTETVQDRLEVILADAREPGVAERAIERCAQRYGQFHALYHVAGGSGRAWGDGPLHTIPLEGWQRTLELNLTTAFLSNGAAIRWFLRENQPGCILNCGSVLANSPSPNLFGTAAYATAKSALLGLTQAAAAAYAPHDIRVNLLAPGLTATPMSLRAQSNPVIQEFITRKQPLDGGRMGRPDDLDAAVIWLLSEGSRYVTGQVIAVDGGWSVSDASPSQALPPGTGSPPRVS